MMKFVFRIFGILVVLVFVLGSAFVYDAWLRMPGENAKEISFEVASGENAGMISRRLEEARIISSAPWFEWYLRFTGQGTRFQAGSFALLPGMSFSALASALTDAGSREIQITIPEGYTLKQIEETVRRAFPDITAVDWQGAVGPASPLKDSKAILAGVPPSLDLEGYLFPDTYRFRNNATALEIASRMIDTLDRRLRENAVPVDDLHTLLTLASIVEREVRRVDDMRNIADIFEKRLAAGIPLQADSTVNYVTGSTKTSVTFEETKIDSPYNTYRYPGLPPGPISNPGMNAILAVLHPADNPWYYFLTTSDGRVIYARTFSEHVANKQKYLR